MPEKRRRSPAEKKALSYAKDRRKGTMKSDKGDRKAIPKARACGHRKDRRKAAETLSSYEQLDETTAGLAENALVTDIGRLQRFQKWPGMPLGEAIKAGDEGRAKRHGRKQRARNARSRWDEEAYLALPGMVRSEMGWAELPMRALLSLEDVANALGDTQDPWWIIGSAAVALHGGEPGTIADIDVITSLRDLEQLYEHLPLTNSPDPAKGMFVSERFGRWSEPMLDVEFMTGLKVRVDGVWHAVQPTTRQAFRVGGATVYAPEREELIAMLRLFGRQKDLRRAATLP